MTKKYMIGNFLSQPGGFKAFIPGPFPPTGGYEFSPSIIHKSIEAARLLGKLDGVTKLLPDVNFFLLMYLRKDAAASSQIEGTKATMAEAIEAEVITRDKTPPDVDDILHYIKALKYGMKRVSVDNFPLTLRFFRELHKELMDRARATQFSDPGEFRVTQNWLDGTRPDNARFVPPPVDAMKSALAQLEAFIHADDDIPPIIKAGLIHSQFEILHPFLDGNGRTGRMLITFYLWKVGYLEQPVLYLSSYFKKHKEAYVNRLEDYHNGLVDKWIDFFLDGVIEIAKEAADTVEMITKLRMNDLAKVLMLGKRSAENAGIVLPKLFEQPIVNVNRVQSWTGYSIPGAQKVIDRFIELGILYRKDEDRKYGQMYFYRDYLEIFNGRE
jgi:Fic family protein